MSTTVLEVNAVQKSYSGVQALQGASLSVAKGQVVGLIGPNGAGKTTLFNVISGVVRPDAGSVIYNGNNVIGSTLEQMAIARIARTFQAPRGFSSMTVLDNLTVVPPQRAEKLRHSLFFKKRQQATIRAEAEHVLERLGLPSLRNAQYSQLSGGELRLLEIGRHLMRRVELFLLDEPTAGVSPPMQEKISDVIRGLADEGIAVLIVEHNLRFMFELANTINVMMGGQIICTGDAQTVRQDHRVADAYLGAAQ